MLPKRDGLSVLKALREDRISAPVLILSARGEEWDRVVGFEYGADDYLTKPFSKRELLLRIETALTRAEGRVPGVGEPGRSARFGDVEVDFAAYSMTRAGVRYGLSRRELELLRYFIENEGQPLNRLAILDAVWGRDQDPTPRTVDMHVLKLRRKIEHDPEAPRHLMTIYGVGYRTSDDDVLTIRNPSGDKSAALRA
jgi:DNA-binding response OmpR family regulator